MKSLTKETSLGSRLVFFAFLVFSSLSLQASVQVLDHAGVISEKARLKAEQIVHNIRRETYPIQKVVLETFGSVPDGEKTQDFLRERYTKHQVRGVYLFISLNPKKIFILPSKNTQKFLTNRYLERVKEVFLKSFKEDNFDQGLINGLLLLRRGLFEKFYRKDQEKTTSSLPPKSKNLVFQEAESVNKARIGPFSWSTILWFLIFAGGAYFLIQQLRRSSLAKRSMNSPDRRNRLRNNDNGHDGFDAPSGGGILKGIMGGLAGAMVGNWLYDKFSSSQKEPSAGEPKGEAAIPEEVGMVEEAGMDEIAGDIIGKDDAIDDWGSTEDFGGDDFSDSFSEDW